MHINSCKLKHSIIELLINFNVKIYKQLNVVSLSLMLQLKYSSSTQNARQKLQLIEFSNEKVGNVKDDIDEFKKFISSRAHSHLMSRFTCYYVSSDHIINFAKNIPLTLFTIFLNDLNYIKKSLLQSRLECNLTSEVLFGTLSHGSIISLKHF